jgi:hypothetical protein
MLFNITDDVFERNDLSESNPGKFTEMQRLWDVYVEENGVIVEPE